MNRINFNKKKEQKLYDSQHYLRIKMKKIKQKDIDKHNQKKEHANQPCYNSLYIALLK